MTYEEQAKEFTKAHEQFYESQILPTTVVRQLEENAYACGCKNTERALALTWEDMAKIDAIILDVNNEFAVDYSKEINRQKFYEEVLKRFKEIKDEQVHQATEE